MTTQESLAHSLKAATMQVHKTTESSSFIQQLFKGDCSVENYKYYLWALHEIYQSLETAIDSLKDHKTINQLYFPELFRVKALKQDLQDWDSHELTNIPSSIQQATKNYCQRIQQIAETQPELLVAHIYVRYLGDLSGGQILKKVLPKNFKRDQGFAFYEFPYMDTQQVKNDFRNQLDAIGETNSNITQDICREAINTFTLNSELFNSFNEVH